MAYRRKKQCFQRTMLWVASAAVLASANTALARPYAGFTGMAAAADSAATAATNPAGATRFDEQVMKVELISIFMESTWDGEINGGETTFQSDDSMEMYVPSGYMVRPINDEFSFSFTILGSGMSDDLGDWIGKYFIESYEAINISAFPSISYKINDRLSIAGSLSLTYAVFNQERAIANTLDPGFADGSSELETDGFDAGFGLSTLYQLSENTRLGLSYFSEIDPSLDGKSKFKNLGPNTEAFLTEQGLIGADVEVKSRTPQSIIAGLYHEFPNQHAVTVDLLWSDFSRFKLSEFYFDGNALSESEAEYEDIYAISVGYSWPVTDRWMIGVAGMYIDEMIKDKNRTMTLRLDAMWSLGVAAEWQWTEDRALQFGLDYMSIGDAPVTMPEIPGVGEISGKFSERDGIILKIGMTFGAL